MINLLDETRTRLYKLSGEDYSIIEKCNVTIQFHFSMIGLLVLTILLTSFASALYFTDHLFHNWFLDIGVGLIWGYIVTNMYILLLYTISPTLLPIKSREENVKGGFKFTFSMGLRFLIVVLLAIISAQPINVFLLKPDSNAFAYDIKLLMSTNAYASLITIVVSTVFLTPVYLKYNIRKLGEFYDYKESIEKKMIEDDYMKFKLVYKSLLESNIITYNRNSWSNLMPHLIKLEKINPNSYQRHFDEIQNELINETIEKYEYWEDPPYRTIHKSSKRIILSEQDFLNDIY
jgi:hypothetical protein